MAFVLLCFAVAGSRVTTTGGPYAYVYAAFGSFTAFLCGVLLWVAAVVSTAASGDRIRRYIGDGVARIIDRPGSRGGARVVV